MQKDFIQIYEKLVKSSQSVLHDIYQELSDDTNAPSNKNESLMQERIAKFILTSDNPEITYHSRKTNGQKEHSNFDEFWGEINKLFEEHQTAVHERMHGIYHYLPFAISIGELTEQVNNKNLV